MPTTRVVGAIRTLPFDKQTAAPTIKRLPNSAVGAPVPVKTLPLAPPKPRPLAPAPRAAAIPPPADRTIRMQPATSNGWVAGVVRAARESGVDPALALSIALEESGGNPAAVGDSGSSYGLFQLHKGGALGSMPVTAAPGGALDPYSNAGVVLRAWGRIGGGKGMDPRSALMDYYSRVGRGSSNEIPTTRALGLLGQARQLLAGSGGAPAPAAAPAAAPAGPTLDLGQLQSYMQRSRQAVEQGRTPPSPLGLLKSSGVIEPEGIGALQSYMARSNEAVQRGEHPPDPMKIIGILSAAQARADERAQAARLQQAQNPVGPGAATTLGGGRYTPPANLQGATKAINWATHYLGTPYSWGGGSPTGPTKGIAQGASTVGFDCSSLVQGAWAQVGVQIPRTTGAQIKALPAVASLAQAQPGDLLYPSEDHVMMYMGNGMAVEAPHTGDVVKTIPVSGMRFHAIRRPG